MRDALRWALMLALMAGALFGRGPSAHRDHYAVQTCLIHPTRWIDNC